MYTQARCYPQQIAFFPIPQPTNDQPGQTHELANLNIPSFLLMRRLQCHFCFVIIAAVTMPTMIKA
jgi:hypothetical protein